MPIFFGLAAFGALVTAALAFGRKAAPASSATSSAAPIRPIEPTTPAATSPPPSGARIPGVTHHILPTRPATTPAPIEPTTPTLTLTQLARRTILPPPPSSGTGA